MQNQTTTTDQSDHCPVFGNQPCEYTGIDGRCMWCDRRRPGALRVLMALYEANRALREGGAR